MVIAASITAEMITPLYSGALMMLGLAPPTLTKAGR